MKQATQTVPVVFVLVSDPVGSGLVTNLARPGGNITGFQNFETAIGGKWLELLKVIAPGVRRVGVLYNQNIPANIEFLRTAQAVAGVVGVTVTPTELHNAADIERVITEFAQDRESGLIVTPNPLNARNNETIIGLAARLHFPAIYPFHVDAEKGGLLSYGFDTVEQHRAAAAYVDRILKGEKPAGRPCSAAKFNSGLIFRRRRRRHYHSAIYFSTCRRSHRVRQCPRIADSRHGLVRCTCPLTGAKRTCPFALHTSVNDPKRTCGPARHCYHFNQQWTKVQRPRFCKQR